VTASPEWRPKTASWVGSGGESGALGDTHHLHVAAVKSRATILVRPAHVLTRRKESLRAERPLSCVPRLPRQLGWPPHGARTCHQTTHARRSFPTQDEVLGRLYTPSTLIVQAEPRPITWARPTFAPSTCRAPALPRRCCVTSKMLATPVAPSGCPFERSPPDTFTGMRPPHSPSPSSFRRPASPSAQSPRFS